MIRCAEAPGARAAPAPFPGPLTRPNRWRRDGWRRAGLLGLGVLLLWGLWGEGSHAREPSDLPVPGAATALDAAPLELYALGPGPGSFHPFSLGGTPNGLQLGAFLLERLGHINEARNTVELPLLDLPELAEAGPTGAGSSSTGQSSTGQSGTGQSGTGQSSTGQSVHVLKLRPGLKFSDGTPLTARDLEASFERLRRAAQQPGALRATRALARCFFLVTEVKARDTLQLELSFLNPVRREELAPMLASLPVIPADASDDALMRGTAPTLAPYTVLSVSAGRVQLRANDLYPFGMPKIERLDVHYLSEAALGTILGEPLAETEASRIFVLPPSLAGAAQNRPDLQVRVAESHRVLVLGFSQAPSSHFFQDKALRRAVAHVIDVPALLEALPMPDWLRTPLRGPYAQDRRFKALLKPLPQLKYEPEQGRLELERLGYVRSGETLRDASGQPLTLRLAVDPRVPAGQTLAGLLGEQLLREGILLQVMDEPSQARQTGPRLSSRGGPDLLLQEWLMDEDEGYTELLHSQGVFNPLELADPVLDKLLVLERRSMLLASRERYRREIQTRVEATATALWLWQRRDAVAIQMAPGVGLRMASALDPYTLFRSVQNWSLHAQGLGNDLGEAPGRDTGSVGQASRPPDEKERP